MTSDKQQHEVSLTDHENMADKAHIDQCETTQLSRLTEEEKQHEKKLVRQIDLLIMPPILATYLMNWIDRNNYAAARLQGLEKDLDLDQSQYQTGLSILFVGYILSQVPSNLLLNYCGSPSFYLGFFTITWGTVSALTCLVHSLSGIMVCRFILGVVEAPFFPDVLFYLSRWYSAPTERLALAPISDSVSSLLLRYYVTRLTFGSASASTGQAD